MAVSMPVLSSSTIRTSITEPAKQGGFHPASPQPERQRQQHHRRDGLLPEGRLAPTRPKPGQRIAGRVPHPAQTGAQFLRIDFVKCFRRRGHDRIVTDNDDGKRTVVAAKGAAMAEFEIKLEVPREAARAVRAALEDGPVQKQQLHAIYLDTDDEVLRRHQLVLRLRKEDGRLGAGAQGGGRQAVGAAGARGSCALAGR